jgi:hypothetical protein
MHMIVSTKDDGTTGDRIRPVTGVTNQAVTFRAAGFVRRSGDGT